MGVSHDRKSGDSKLFNVFEFVQKAGQEVLMAILAKYSDTDWGVSVNG